MEIFTTVQQEKKMS